MVVLRAAAVAPGREGQGGENQKDRCAHGFAPARGESVFSIRNENGISKGRGQARVILQRRSRGGPKGPFIQTGRRKRHLGARWGIAPADFGVSAPPPPFGADAPPGIPGGGAKANRC
jgi:hypothetical protein